MTGSYTTNLGLYKPGVNESGWGSSGGATDVNDNWDILDNLGGADGNHTTLNGATSALANSVTTSGILKITVGSKVAVGALSTKCEIRRVTGIAGGGTILSLNTTLKVSHASGANVFVLDGDYAPLEWWLCRAGDSGYDSHQGLQQALIDAGDIGLYGLAGSPSKPYYTSRPVCVNDYTALVNVWVYAYSAFAIDCTVGLHADWSGGVGSPVAGTEPDQFLCTLAGQSGTCTFDGTANTVLIAGTNVGAIWDKITFYAREGSTLPTGIEAGRAYFIRAATNVGQTTEIAVDQVGSALNFTGNGTGDFVWYSPGLARMRWENTAWEGSGVPGAASTVRGLNGVLAFLQQPSFSYNMRCDYFSGPRGGLVLGGQDGDMFHTMVTNCAVGVRLAGHLLYFYGGNIEACDQLWIMDTGAAICEPAGDDGTCNVIVSGFHLESCGQGVYRKQRILGNASVSDGTFTLTFHGQTTDTIPRNASAGTIQAKLEALSNINVGDITVTDFTGGLPSGYVQIEFVATGQYAWAWMDAAQGYGLSIGTGSLIGGVYTADYLHPEGCCIQQLGGRAIVFESCSQTANLFDFPRSFYRREATASPNFTGIVLKDIIETAGGGGYAVQDLVRNYTIPWTDGNAASGGAGQILDLYVSGARHSQASHYGEHHVGDSGKMWGWESGAGEFRIGNGAVLRQSQDNTGPIITTRAGTPESNISAPLGSLCTDSTNGELYVKKTGSGATGWKLVTHA